MLTLTQAILDIVAEHHGVKKVELMTKVGIRGTQKIVEAKQSAVFLLYRYTRYSYDQISTILDYESRQAVMKARKNVKAISSANKAYKLDLQAMESKIVRD